MNSLWQDDVFIALTTSFLFSNENSASDKDVKIDFVSRVILVRNAHLEFLLILFTLLFSKLNFFMFFPFLGEKKKNLFTSSLLLLFLHVVIFVYHFSQFLMASFLHSFINLVRASWMISERKKNGLVLLVYVPDILRGRSYHTWKQGMSGCG